ncbi:MAG TPA: hypothetical protein VEZ11_01345, partial [Thermoanaerobaculia bacterium]|nr:hypothetical protein [Thermoanaerobaculia bacterium]
IRHSLAAYLDKQTPEGEQKGADQKGEAAASAGRITPQLGDSFLDRLVSLVNQATDTAYRQRIAHDLQTASLEIIPVEQAVAYDIESLNQIKTTSRSANADPKAVRAQIEDTRQVLRDLIAKVNEIYQGVSRNLEPATQLYSEESSFSRTERSVSLSRLALFGLAVLLISIPVVIAICLLVNRIREEETFEKEA